ncbi:TonB-dependent receptor [Bacteroides acidifaciens]|mgnify:FL=1|uniref:TonB-dependent receptor n=1 Tax=Bacteroides acidifaciens TaxID=85831 RepID=A0A7K3MFE0_9BACE|nr:TonB-dependent receptor [Bacteroides acidifaciens]MBF0731351.1 TonB-dependent receptor [Bacteroides acidifaciens]MBF0836218.1 TonB-dependent receptor [Bacteroides acidifaciens]NDO53161.1 TonB-dependent receptor [Bacteroides acidifaciens]TFU45597.1 TonB-dependent receptor [Bacteroides acidifaciens]
MKKIGLMTIALLGAGITVHAQTSAKDSVKVVNLQEVQVVSTRATAKTPVAFTNVKKEQISKQNFGQDIPFLLSTTPSVLTTSDAGAGVGYTTIRVRGTDATRINVTANGIPMNDSESHAIFWVNTPDFASSLEDIQIQRGAGTSTNGSGAFGASINMRTQSISSKPYAEVSGSYGSFNTHKETVKVGTGLLNKYWAFDARLSNIQSDGYRDRASSDLKSYFVQGGYFGENTTIKFITFGGKEKTYHAWDGISKEQLENDRTYNPNGVILDDNKGKGNPIGFYDDQMDNYRQTHYQLLLNHIFSPAWNLNIAFHYTNGFGYYQEYKNGRSLEEYGLKPFYLPGNSEPQKKTNLVRQKLVDSNFGGGIFSLNYQNEKLNASFGGGLNRYSNDHYGKVIWVKNYTEQLDPEHEYYRNTGGKTDGNIYLKANYQLIGGLSAYADLQYRYIHYTIDGDNDKWDFTATPERLQRLDVKENFSFFNPKAGLFWQINPNHSAYASFSVAQKEPTRNNYTDGMFDKYPKAEKLLDYELGYTYRNEWVTAGVNLYYMDYTDQLVLNGKTNDIGEAMAENVKDSYRMGIELAFGAKFNDWLRWDINGTWSKNRIKDYTGYVYDESLVNGEIVDNLWTQTAIKGGNSPISFSPSFIGNSLITLGSNGLEISLQSQYVSRQYLDNFGTKENSLDAYFVSHLSASYSFKTRHTKGITIGATVYNLFDTKYETNGYSQSVALYENGDKTKPYVTKHDPRFYPMAGTNILAHITFRF